MPKIVGSALLKYRHNLIHWFVPPREIDPESAGMVLALLLAINEISGVMDIMNFLNYNSAISALSRFSNHAGELKRSVNNEYIKELRKKALQKVSSDKDDASTEKFKEFYKILDNM